jgi:hypothetical protein
MYENLLIMKIIEKENEFAYYIKTMEKELKINFKNNKEFLPLVIREYLNCIDVNLNDKENKKIEDFLIEVAKKLEDKKKVRKVDIKEIIKCVKEKGIITNLINYARIIAEAKKSPFDEKELEEVTLKILEKKYGENKNFNYKLILKKIVKMQEDKEKIDVYKLAKEVKKIYDEFNELYNKPDNEKINEENDNKENQYDNQIQNETYKG